MKLTADLVRLFTGQVEEISEFESNNLSDVDSSDNYDQKNRPVIEYGYHPIVLILDDAHLLDHSSWRLLDGVLQKSERLAIIMSMTTNERDRI